MVLLTNFVHKIHNGKVRCSSTEEFIELSISTNFTEEPTVEIRASNINSQWHLQGGCEKVNGSILKCRRNTMNNSQYFRINTSTTFELLWLYNCYKAHGVNSIKISEETWHSFNIKWFYYNWDDQFLKEETISITDVSANITYSENIEISSNNSYSFHKGTIKTLYYVCIKTTYITSLALFEDASDVIKTVCKNVTTTEKSQELSEQLSSSLKTSLLVVGIGVVVLLILFILFIIYNKKCKAGGDHNFDMNKEESLMADHQLELDT